MEVQTRNLQGLLNFFPSVKDAYEESKRDLTIWKISWSDKLNNYRFVKKLKKEEWNEFSEKKLNEMNVAYKNASDDDLFWINQSSIPSPEWYTDISKQYDDIKISDPNRYENIMFSHMIKEVLTIRQFEDKYLN